MITGKKQSGNFDVKGEVWVASHVERTWGNYLMDSSIIGRENHPPLFIFLKYGYISYESPRSKYC